ncbi:MAG: helix-turn-helix transcriptional regulator [Acidiferrobacterales bacterium]
MLILKCRARESIWIGPGEAARDTPVREVFNTGLIEIVVSCIDETEVVLKVEVPPSFHVLRTEIVPPILDEVVSSQNTRTILAQKLITLRFIKKLSCEDLARISGVALPTLNNTERHDTPLGFDEVKALAKGLGVSVAELLTPPGITAEERVVMALLEEGLEG